MLGNQTPRLILMLVPFSLPFTEGNFSSLPRLIMPVLSLPNGVGRSFMNRRIC